MVSFALATVFSRGVGQLCSPVGGLYVMAVSCGWRFLIVFWPLMMVICQVATDGVVARQIVTRPVPVSG